MRTVAILVLLLGTACTYEPLDADPTAQVAGDDDDLALVAVEPMVSTEATREPLPGLVAEVQRVTAA